MRRKQDARFGQQVHELRKSKNLSQRTLGSQVGVSFTYVPKIENEKLDFGDYPSEELICKIARASDVDEDELLLLAKKIPAAIYKSCSSAPRSSGRWHAATTRRSIGCWLSSTLA